MGLAAEIYHEIGVNRAGFDAAFNHRITTPKNTAYWLLYHTTWMNYRANIRRHSADGSHHKNDQSHKNKSAPIGRKILELLLLHPAETIESTLDADCD